MRVTLKDVAREAGVSLTTVSLIINKKNHRFSRETVDRVMQIARKLNFTPNRIARSLATSSTRSIALIFPDLANPYFPGIAKQIAVEAMKLDYSTILINYDVKSNKEPIAILNSGSVDGALLVTRHYGIFAKQNPIIHYLPTLLLEPSVDVPDGVSCVAPDFYQGGFTSTSWLIKNGHSRIACLAGPQDIVSSRQKVQGFADAMKQAGVPNPSDFIIHTELNIESGHHAVDQLCAMGVTAAVCSSDFSALGLIMGLIGQGYHVPGDISVFGYDNISMGTYTTPSLSTVGLSVEATSKLAVKHLISLIENPDTKAIHKKISARIILRESTQPLIP